VSERAVVVQYGQAAAHRRDHPAPLLYVSIVRVRLSDAVWYLRVLLCD
jgi:hypothetical protein